MESGNKDITNSSKALKSWNKNSYSPRKIETQVITEKNKKINGIKNSFRTIENSKESTPMLSTSCKNSKENNPTQIKSKSIEANLTMHSDKLKNSKILLINFTKKTNK